MVVLQGERKGISNTAVGIILASFQLIVFVTSPVWGLSVSLFSGWKCHHTVQEAHLNQTEASILADQKMHSPHGLGKCLVSLSDFNPRIQSSAKHLRFLFSLQMTRIGAKFMFVTGILVTSVCAILFGFVRWILCNDEKQKTREH